MHLRVQKRDDRWHATADEVPGTETIESTYETAVAALLSKIFQVSTVEKLPSVDLFLQVGERSQLVECKHLVDSASTLASRLAESLNEALAERDLNRAVPLSAARSQVAAAAVLLRQALEAYASGETMFGDGPAFSEAEEASLSAREADVISGKVATRSLADVVASAPQPR
jgi:hypothetical protein